LYPHEHGVVGNDPKLPVAGLRPVPAKSDPQYKQYYEAFDEQFERWPNFIRDLTERGYATLQTGKWWHSNPVRTAGFSHAMTRGDIFNESRHGDMGLAIGRTGLGAIEYFIETQSKGRPFFVWYAPYLPHAPHTPPSDLLAKYRERTPSEAQARYWANVEWFDRTCVDLIKMLEELGVRENTVILYTCDNGWVQDLEKVNRFAERSKRTPYEAGVRTPIMLSRPGTIAPRLDKDHFASNIDLWPTLSAAIGIEGPAEPRGINLLDEQALAERSGVFGEVFAHDIQDFERPDVDLYYRWTIQGDWKLILPHERNRPNEMAELYNIRSDPGELKDLAKEEPEILERLTRIIDQWWTPPSR